MAKETFDNDFKHRYLYLFEDSQKLNQFTKNLTKNSKFKFENFFKTPFEAKFYEPFTKKYIPKAIRKTFDL